MKFKKLALSLGTLSAIAAPIATVVSCGGTSSTQYSEDDLLKMSNFKSSEAHSKLQDLWLAKVLRQEYKATDKAPIDILRNFSAMPAKFKADFKTTLTWVLKNKLFASKDALSTIYQTLKSNAPDALLNNGSVQRDIVTNLNVKVFDRSEINNTVDKIMNDNDWENIFYNYTIDAKEGDTFNPSILGVKDLILKMMVTKKYLSLSATDFKAALPEENSKLAAKYKDETLVTPSKPNFPLLVSVMNSRLAYKTSIELDASKSREFIISNIDNNLTTAEVPKIFSATDTKFVDKLTYSLKAQTRVDSILAKVPSYGIDEDSTIGFQGLSTLPSGDDNLDTATVSKIKLAKDPESRDGFVVDSDLLTVADVKKDKDGKDTTITKIRFTDKDKTKVELNYYTSLMPTYDTTDKTLEFNGFDATHLDLLMDEAYTKDSALYSTAIKYFTERKDSVKIEVTNDWARNYYLDEGLKYIADGDE